MLDLVPVRVDGWWCLGFQQAKQERRKGLFAYLRRTAKLSMGAKGVHKKLEVVGCSWTDVTSEMEVGRAKRQKYFFPVGTDCGIHECNAEPTL